ncbi:MAG: hypothetical protein WDO24_00050 [Pseudomonadota bacterium]
MTEATNSDVAGLEAEELTRALERLPPGQRQALELAEAEGNVVEGSIGRDRTIDHRPEGGDPSRASNRSAS